MISLMADTTEDVVSDSNDTRVSSPMCCLSISITLPNILPSVDLVSVLHVLSKHAIS